MKGVGEGIFMVGGYVNAFLVDGDQGVTLIDTGMPRKDGLIRDALDVIGRRPSEVVAIVLTHSHNDHTGGAAVLKEATGAPLIAPEIDTATIEGRAAVPPPPMLPGPFAFLTRLMPRALPVAVDVMVTEAAQDGVPQDLRVVDTPGHTPGHTSYLLDRGGGTLFVGDAAMVHRDGSVGPGFINRGGGPVLVDSIAHIAGLEFESAVFGHSAPIAGAASDLFREYVRRSQHG
jgi:glyoxylase-like metal-dependent hydrolase (beta-lactamase superfamily II)